MTWTSALTIPSSALSFGLDEYTAVPVLELCDRRQDPADDRLDVLVNIDDERDIDIDGGRERVLGLLGESTEQLVVPGDGLSANASCCSEWRRMRRRRASAW